MTRWRRSTVRLISIPYTGTNFLKRLLESDDIPVKRTHTYVDNWRAFASKAQAVVGPMRDPMLHVTSCEQRGATLRTHHFNEFAEWMDPKQVCCVDLDPAEQLAKLSSYLGLQVRAHHGWDPVGKQAEDDVGKRADYLRTGTFEGMEDQVRIIEHHTRDWLRELGYTMGWLDW